MKEKKFNWEAYVFNMMEGYGLDSSPEQRDLIVQQLKMIEALAQGFVDFDLPMHIESASIFRA
jgi:hypothetical protein